MRSSDGNGRRARAGIFFSIWATASGIAAQTTWRVPGDAATINDAIARAAPGDRILLVGTSLYGTGNDAAGIVIDKPLTIEPPAGQRAGYWFGDPALVAVRVTRLRGGRMLVRNFDIVPDPDETRAFSRVGSRLALHVDLTAAETGAIVLDSVTARGLLTNADDPCPGAVINAGAGVDLAIRRCSFTGATGDVSWITNGEVGWRGSPGAVIASAGDCVVEDCTFRGGDGGYAWWSDFSYFPAKDGGAGLRFGAARGGVFGGTVTDGAGGSVGRGNYQGPANPCDYVGLAGVSSFPSDVADVFHQPGARGSAANCPQSPPPPRVLGAGVRDLTIGSQQSTGRQFAANVRSRAFAEGWTALALGTAATRWSLPGFDGALWVEGIFHVVPVAPRLGAAWVVVPMPVAPSLPDALDLTLQPLHLTAATMRWAFGTPATLTIFP